ncbi:recombinase zinc beta ribbon domain-containing protein [Vibrio natriegens]|uniref:recombinase zinc beta ribbon domain-containing protein n=1 Tax=Vibrio natriegens TaxID=691 RepID=UPI001EFE7FDC|nr:recombinase zinc beta ribbon domain-containing protein [Vibrio natriegens]
MTNPFNKNADGVLKAIELYLKGVGCLKIKQHLDEHYPYEAVRKKGRKTSQTDKWDFTAINQVFTKPSLIGEKHITVGGVKYKLEDYYPPLIDVATFQKLQQIKSLKAGRAPAKPTTHLLKGLVKCGVCGGRMVFIDKGRGNHAINYVCSNAAKGNHQRENYSVQMLELAIIRLSNDELLRSKIDENSYEAERAQLLKQKDDLEHELIELKSRYIQKKRKTILELIEDAEDRLESVISELEIVKPINIIQAFHELSDIKFDAEMMNDFNHPLRHELKLNLNKVIDHIQINRTKELSNSTKSGYVSCISITVVFKNKQRRILTSTPFQYFDNVRGKNIFVGYKYEYDVPFEELTRNKKLIVNLLSELHCYDLLHKLYPSKGRYEWTGMPIDFGTVHQKGTNLLGALKHMIEAGSWEYGIKKQFSEGIQYTIIEKNSI